MPSLTTSGAGRQGMVWSVGLTLSVLKSVIPGDEIFDALSMITDGVDPFGFNTILTRGFFDGESKIIYDSLSEYSDIDQKSCITNAKQNYPAADEKDIIDICKQSVGVWTIDTPRFDTINSSCFSNYIPPESISKSGKPGVTCDPDYVMYYNKYHDVNKDSYISKNIITSKTISDTIGFSIPDTTGRSNLVDVTDKVNSIKNIILTSVGILFLIIVILFIFVINN